MFLMEDLNQRIDHILTLKNFSPKKTAAILGIKINDLKNYSTDTIPNIEFLFSLVEYFHVNPNYLMTGTEPVFMTTEKIESLNLEQNYL